MKDLIIELRVMDEFSDLNSAVHGIHPIAIFLVTAAAILVTLSFGKYEIVSILPMLLYPVFVFEMSGLPKRSLLRRTALGLFFVACVGIFNPVFDRTWVFSVAGISVTAGWMSFVSLLVKGGLTVVSALLMVAVLGMNRLVNVLYWFRVPKVFVLQIVLTFRYLSVLIEEVSLTYNAYSLRSNGQNGIHFKIWGTFLGNILLRTFDRAERIYEAMVLRGFDGEFTLGAMDSVELKDILYAGGWIAYFTIVRTVNFAELIGMHVVGG